MSNSFFAFEADNSEEDLKTSLMTSLKMIESEIIEYLEDREAEVLSDLVRHATWPDEYVYMAIGGLIRRGVVQVIELDDRIYVLNQSSPHFVS